MRNDEYIVEFLRKHNYNGNVIINTKYGNSWDDVVSIICNEADIPSKKVIDISDIRYDVMSEMPEDAFQQWINYCDKTEDISYFEWCTKRIECYRPKFDDSHIIQMNNEIERSIDFVLNKVYNKKYFMDNDKKESDE